MADAVSHASRQAASQKRDYARAYEQYVNAALSQQRGANDSDTKGAQQTPLRQKSMAGGALSPNNSAFQVNQSLTGTKAPVAIGPKASTPANTANGSRTQSPAQSPRKVLIKKSRTPSRDRAPTPPYDKDHSITGDARAASTSRPSATKGTRPSSASVVSPMRHVAFAVPSPNGRASTPNRQSSSHAQPLANNVYSPYYYHQPQQLPQQLQQQQQAMFNAQFATWTPAQQQQYVAAYMQQQQQLQQLTQASAHPATATKAASRPPSPNVVAKGGKLYKMPVGGGKGRSPSPAAKSKAAPSSASYITAADLDKFKGLVDTNERALIASLSGQSSPTTSFHEIREDDTSADEGRGKLQRLGGPSPSYQPPPPQEAPATSKPKADQNASQMLRPEEHDPRLRLLNRNEPHRAPSTLVFTTPPRSTPQQGAYSPPGSARQSPSRRSSSQPYQQTHNYRPSNSRSAEEWRSAHHSTPRPSPTAMPIGSASGPAQNPYGDGEEVATLELPSLQRPVSRSGSVRGDNSPHHSSEGYTRLQPGGPFARVLPYPTRETSPYYPRQSPHVRAGLSQPNAHGNSISGVHNPTGRYNGHYSPRSGSVDDVEMAEVYPHNTSKGIRTPSGHHAQQILPSPDSAWDNRPYLGSGGRSSRPADAVVLLSLGKPNGTPNGHLYRATNSEESDLRTEMPSASGPPPRNDRAIANEAYSRASNDGGAGDSGNPLSRQHHSAPPRESMPIAANSVTNTASNRQQGGRLQRRPPPSGDESTRQHPIITARYERILSCWRCGTILFLILLALVAAAVVLVAAGALMDSWVEFHNARPVGIMPAEFGLYTTSRTNEDIILLQAADSSTATVSSEDSNVTLCPATGESSAWRAHKWLFPVNLSTSSISCATAELVWDLMAMDSGSAMLWEWVDRVAPEEPTTTATTTTATTTEDNSTTLANATSTTVVPTTVENSTTGTAEPTNTSADTNTSISTSTANVTVGTDGTNDTSTTADTSTTSTIEAETTTVDNTSTATSMNGSSILAPGGGSEAPLPVVPEAARKAFHPQDGQGISLGASMDNGTVVNTTFPEQEDSTDFMGSARLMPDFHVSVGFVSICRTTGLAFSECQPRWRKLGDDSSYDAVIASNDNGFGSIVEGSPVPPYYNNALGMPISHKKHTNENTFAAVLTHSLRLRHEAAVGARNNTNSAIANVEERLLQYRGIVSAEQLNQGLFGSANATVLAALVELHSQLLRTNTTTILSLEREVERLRQVLRFVAVIAGSALPNAAGFWSQTIVRELFGSDDSKYAGRLATLNNASLANQSVAAVPLPRTLVGLLDPFSEAVPAPLLDNPDSLSNYSAAISFAFGMNASSILSRRTVANSDDCNCGTNQLYHNGLGTSERLLSASLQTIAAFNNYSSIEGASDLLSFLAQVAGLDSVNESSSLVATISTTATSTIQARMTKEPSSMIGLSVTGAEAMHYAAIASIGVGCILLFICALALIRLLYLRMVMYNLAYQASRCNPSAYYRRLAAMEAEAEAEERAARKSGAGTKSNSNKGKPSEDADAPAINYADRPSDYPDGSSWSVEGLHRIGHSMVLAVLVGKGMVVRRSRPKYNEKDSGTDGAGEDGKKSSTPRSKKTVRAADAPQIITDKKFASLLRSYTRARCIAFSTLLAATLLLFFAVACVGALSTETPLFFCFDGFYDEGYQDPEVAAGMWASRHILAASVESQISTGLGLASLPNDDVMALLYRANATAAVTRRFAYQYSLGASESFITDNGVEGGANYIGMDLPATAMRLKAYSYRFLSNARKGLNAIFFLNREQSSVDPIVSKMKLSHGNPSATPTEIGLSSSYEMRTTTKNKRAGGHVYSAYQQAMSRLHLAMAYLDIYRVQESNPVWLHGNSRLALTLNATRRALLLVREFEETHQQQQAINGSTTSEVLEMLQATVASLNQSMTMNFSASRVALPSVSQLLYGAKATANLARMARAVSRPVLAAASPVDNTLPLNPAAEAVRAKLLKLGSVSRNTVIVEDDRVAFLLAALNTPTFLNATSIELGANATSDESLSMFSPAGRLLPPNLLYWVPLDSIPLSSRDIAVGEVLSDVVVSGDETVGVSATNTFNGSVATERVLAAWYSHVSSTLSGHPVSSEDDVVLRSVTLSANISAGIGSLASLTNITVRMIPIAEATAAMLTTAALASAGVGESRQGTASASSSRRFSAAADSNSYLSRTTFAGNQYGHNLHDAQLGATAYLLYTSLLLLLIATLVLIPCCMGAKRLVEGRMADQYRAERTKYFDSLADGTQKANHWDDGEKFALSNKKRGGRVAVVHADSDVSSLQPLRMDPKLNRFVFGNSVPTGQSQPRASYNVPPFYETEIGKAHKRGDIAEVQRLVALQGLKDSESQGSGNQRPSSAPSLAPSLTTSKKPPTSPARAAPQFQEEYPVTEEHEGVAVRATAQEDERAQKEGANTGRHGRSNSQEAEASRSIDPRSPSPVGSPNTNNNNGGNINGNTFAELSPITSAAELSDEDSDSDEVARRALALTGRGADVTPKKVSRRGSTDAKAAAAASDDEFNEDGDVIAEAGPISSRSDALLRVEKSSKYYEKLERTHNRVLRHRSAWLNDCAGPQLDLLVAETYCRQHILRRYVRSIAKWIAFAKENNNNVEANNKAIVGDALEVLRLKEANDVEQIAKLEAEHEHIAKMLEDLAVEMDTMVNEERAAKGREEAKVSQALQNMEATEHTVHGRSLSQDLDDVAHVEGQPLVVEGKDRSPSRSPSPEADAHHCLSEPETGKVVSLSSVGQLSLYQRQLALEKKARHLRRQSHKKRIRRVLRLPDSAGVKLLLNYWESQLGQLYNTSAAAERGGDQAANTDDNWLFRLFGADEDLLGSPDHNKLPHHSQPPLPSTASAGTQTPDKPLFSSPHRSPPRALSQASVAADDAFAVSPSRFVPQRNSPPYGSGSRGYRSPSREEERSKSLHEAYEEHVSVCNSHLSPSSRPILLASEGPMAVEEAVARATDLIATTQSPPRWSAEWGRRYNLASAGNADAIGIPQMHFTRTAPVLFPQQHSSPPPPLLPSVTEGLLNNGSSTDVHIISPARSPAKQWDDPSASYYAPLASVNYLSATGHGIDVSGGNNVTTMSGGSRSPGHSRSQPQANPNPAAMSANAYANIGSILTAHSFLDHHHNNGASYNSRRGVNTVNALSPVSSRSAAAAAYPNMPQSIYSPSSPVAANISRATNLHDLNAAPIVSTAAAIASLAAEALEDDAAIRSYLPAVGTSSRTSTLVSYAHYSGSRAAAAPAETTWRPSNYDVESVPTADELAARARALGLGEFEDEDEEERTERGDAGYN